MKFVEVHDCYKLHVRRIKNHRQLLKFCKVCLVCVSPNATLADKMLQILTEVIEKLLAKIRYELTVNRSKSTILHGSRLVVHRSLRSIVISIEHEGHQGLVKRKQLLRETIWFPGIEKDVQNMTENCLPCQAVTNT